MTWDLLITHIKGLAQVRDASVTVVKGSAMAELPVLSDAYLAISGGRIAAFGSMQELRGTATRQIDASGCFVLPGFIDSHTHLIFAAGREEEFVMKIKGATYQQIAAKGGGILNSAKKVQRATEDELYENALARIHEITTTGTVAVEIKSGYGLTVKDELKMLRVARRLGRETALQVKTTLLGAHAVPLGMSKPDYVSLILNEMIPAAAEEQLADYVDVFCEEGFFTVDETIQIAEEGKRFGLKPRIHANQLGRSGGVQAGVATGAISVDHLENIGEEEIELLRHSNTMPTVLPGAAFFLNLPFPPARKMIEAGLPLVIASDYNPGSAPSGNLPLMLALACIKMKMTPEEALNAVTLNAAHALELSASHGSIAVGKAGSVIITHPMPSLAYMPYQFGSRHIRQVIINGVEML